MRNRSRLSVAILALAWLPQVSSAQQLASKMDEYLKPYVESGNFSGVVLVERDGRVLFHRGLRIQDARSGVPNRKYDRFHIASALPMPFTAAAVASPGRSKGRSNTMMRRSETTWPAASGGGSHHHTPTCFDQRSGLQDINTLPEYNDILRHHRTPAGLS